MADTFKKSFDAPDEVRTPPKAKVDVVNFGEATAMRATFEPGWKWSECVKPIAGTDSCQTAHFGYVESGTLVVRMDDGTELTFAAGDVMHVPAGHDAWVEGDEPCVAFDFQGAANYAVPKAGAAG
jgi:hypothetical protein